MSILKKKTDVLYSGCPLYRFLHLDRCGIRLNTMGMNVPNSLTGLRLLFSPLFFAWFFLWPQLSLHPAIGIGILWLLFIAIEISDFLDGYIARRYNQVSDLGKVLDPFADSLSRLTYFICFTGYGIMPLWVFLIIMYRDLGVSFVRLLFARRGESMGARMSGKLKALLYALAGILGLLWVSSDSLPLLSGILAYVSVIAQVCFYVSAAIAVWSMWDYGYSLIKKSRQK